jgi:purine-nucleoside/S-methyl-5'-thioadenosine phosphorylase / adenosine deaminase
VSTGPYAGLNLATHTGDDVEAVRANRDKVSRALGIEGEWVTLRQVHGGRALVADDPAACEEGDALVTSVGGPPAAVLVADCIPVALVGSTRSAVVHVGWRGLCAGVIEEALKALDDEAVRAWIGPGIGKCHFEVGREVADSFEAAYPDALDFCSEDRGKLHFDLPGAARWVLRSKAVDVDDDPASCTVCDPNLYSYRRDGVTGRQAVIVWRS